MSAPAPAAASAESPPGGRFTCGLIFDVFEALERYGYRCGGDRQRGQAVALLFRLAAAYEGSRDDDAELTP